MPSIKGENVGVHAKIAVYRSGEKIAVDGNLSESQAWNSQLCIGMINAFSFFFNPLAFARKVSPMASNQNLSCNWIIFMICS